MLRTVLPSLAVLVAGGVGADLFENYYSLRVLTTDITDWNAAANTLLVLTYLKWSLIFVVFGAAATIFLRLKKSEWWNAAIVPLAIGAVVGLVGTIFNGYSEDHIKPELKPVIEKYRRPDAPVTLDGPIREQAA